MRQEEILEYNKLCAEFLDWKYHPETANHGRLDNSWEYKPHYYHFDLKFHSDWNWIMEVKRHIVGLGYCWFQFPDIIQINENATISSFKIIKIEFNKLKEKEAVVEAINQFLIWYKQQ
jgi:hypothetical protein